MESTIRRGVVRKTSLYDEPVEISFYVGNILWSIKYNRVPRSENSSDSVDLFCNKENISPLWKVEANFTIRTIAKASGKEDSVHTNSFCFDSKKNHYTTTIGKSERIYYDFESDNIIEFEITIEIKKIVGLGYYDVDFSRPTEFSDVVLVVEGKKIHVNKTYLAMHSSVFKAMFFSGFKEENQEEIEMKDIAYDELIDLLTFIHPGAEVPIHNDNLEYLLELADRFDIQKVALLCEKYLMLENETDNCRKFEISDKYSLTQLHSHALKIMNHGEIRNLTNSEKYKEFKVASRDGLIERLLEIIEESSNN